MKGDVQQLVGAVCITFEDGEELHATYRRTFVRGDTFFLGFAGTRIFVSQFFNAAVGQLLKDHLVNDVRRRLKFLNLSAVANASLRRLVENAERHYRDPKHREAQDRVLADQEADA